jgi:hypothetical protein
MNPPALLRPANARSAPLPFASADATKPSANGATNSFSSLLDRADSPVGERPVARSRNSRGRSLEGREPGDSRSEAKPIREARKKVPEESPENLAGAWAMTPAPVPQVELDSARSRQNLLPSPGATGDASVVGDAASPSAESGPVVPLRPSLVGADGKMGSNVPIELKPIAKDETSVGAKPDANSSGDTNKEFVAAGQPATEDSIRDCSTHAAAGISELPKELFDEIKNPRGIAAAKLDEQMKNTEAQDEFAGPTKQILPGAQADQLPPPRATARREGGRSLVASASLEVFGSAASAKNAVPTPSMELSPASDLLTGQLSPVDRMAKIISREVQIFKRTADETMEVVLTPDPHTQISLRLQWREGTVEILALCHHGDYHALNTQWPLLQSALEHQGVQLSQLTQPAHTGYTDFFHSAGFAQSKNDGRRQPDPMVAADPLPPVAALQPSGGPSLSSVARRRHLLESWA